MSLTTLQTKPRAAGSNALVRELRTLCGLTQEQFAAKLGVTLITVNRWENYRSKPMPLARRQLRILLLQMSYSGIKANQQSARLLLAQYFPHQKF